MSATAVRSHQVHSGELIDTYARARIDYRVRRLARKYCLDRQEIEDLGQEFLRALSRAQPRFNPRRCNRKTFVQAVLDHVYLHHVRQFSVRDQREAFNPTPFDDIAVDMEYDLPDPLGELDFRLADLDADVAVILARMPARYREVCQALMTARSPRQAARQLGITQSWMSKLIRRMRPYFAQAGYRRGD